MCDIMSLSKDVSHTCRPQHKAGKQDLFPLPACDVTGEDGQNPSFLRTTVFASNSLAGSSSAGSTRCSPSALGVVKRLKHLVEGSPMLVEVIPQMDFQDFFATRSVDNSGDEIKVAMNLKWESIQVSLPKEVGFFISEIFVMELFFLVWTILRLSGSG